MPKLSPSKARCLLTEIRWNVIILGIREILVLLWRPQLDHGMVWVLNLFLEAILVHKT